RLAVSSVVPEPYASAVPFDAPIFVQFNRAVVPLGQVKQSLSPVHIDPPTDGSGRWLTTSLFTFKPSNAWAPAATYHITVPTTVADVLGGALASEYTWSFTTLP